MPSVSTTTPARGRDPRGMALLLAGAWFLLLACFIREFAGGYFPTGDEWAWLANSNLASSQPLDWLRGMSHYFGDYPGAEPPRANYLRPVINLAYAIGQLLLGPFSGWLLGFTMLAFAACAGLVYWAWVAAHPGQWRLALMLSALVPLMPGFMPSLIPLFMPSSGFDAVAAAFCLLAYLAYHSGRWWATVTMLTLAVLSKETALPVAAAFPLHAALTARGQLLGNRTIQLRVLLLALPVLLWLALRLHAYGSVTGGAYAFTPDPELILRRVLVWPFWSDSMVPALQDTDLVRAFDAALRRINVIVAGAALVVVAVKLLRSRTPGLAELCFIASYAFMLLTGIYARYGPVLDVFLLLTVAIWCAAVPRVRVIVLTAVTVSVAACVYKSWLAYPHLRDSFQRMHAVSRDYVDLLRSFAAHDRVVILNDPTTRHSRLQWLESLAGTRADIVKASDFPWAAFWLDPHADCNISLEADPRVPGRYKFSQSCGIALLGPHIFSGSATMQVKLCDWAQIRLVPETPAAGQPGIWREMTVDLSGGPVRLVYFDPSGNRWVRQQKP